MDPVDPNTHTSEKQTPASTAKTVQIQTGEKHPLTGQVLGTYRIDDVLGRGGMGVVFRASDTSLDRTVALKVLAPELSGDGDYVQRFLREAKAAAALDHPNVVAVHAAGQTGGYCWIAMQFAKGVPLSGHMRKGRKFTVKESLAIVRQVALALGAAHKAGIVHRDIKPSNIMLDETGRALVMDFGLSRGIQTGERITRTGTYLGTPEYSSPEQCETNDLDGRSDLYSLGVVLYELLTGRVPHVAETPLALFRKIAEERPTPVSVINKQVPPAVQAILDRLLAKDRDRRYRTAEEVIRDIDKAAKGEAVAAPAPSRKGLGVYAGVATLLIAGALAGWKWPHSVQPTPQPAPVVTPGGSGQAQVTPPVPVEQPTAVIVLDFKDLKGDKDNHWMEVGIPELLLGKLDAALGADVVPREVLLDTMAQAIGKKVAAAGADVHLSLGPDLEKVVAQLHGRVIVMGNFVVVANGQLRITANVYERKAGATTLTRLDTITENGSPDDLFGLVDDLAGRVAGLSQPAPAAAAAPSLGLIAPAPPASDPAGDQRASDAKMKEEGAQHQRRAGRLARFDNMVNNARESNSIYGAIWADKANVRALKMPGSPVEGAKGVEAQKLDKEPQAGAAGGEALADEKKDMEKLLRDDLLARTKRICQNLQVCEDLDLKGQKAMRSSQEFIDTLCNEECKETLEQKYQSLCKDEKAGDAGKNSSKGK